MERRLLDTITPEQMRTDIASRVQSRRKEQHLTQEGLAAKSGVSLGSIRRFEQSGEISLRSLIRIAFVLGYEEDLDALFTRQHFNSIQDIIDAQH